MRLDLTEDHHVHSTFSDGRDSLAQNAEVARERGLRLLGCVDHVRRDTPWIADFVRAVRAHSSSELRLRAGLEAKLLNAEGAIDAPAELHGVDAVFIADHQFPGEEGCMTPIELRHALQRGTMSATQVLETLVCATAKSLRQCEHPVIAHLFSILPKVGLEEDQVDESLISHLASEALACGARIEVDERWRCPSARVLAVFARHGVPILASTDSHTSDAIGRYTYVKEVADALARIEGSLEAGLDGRIDTRDDASPLQS